MEYFIFRDGKQTGPISLEKLYEENIDGDTLVWNTSMKEWTKASEVPELAPVIAGANKPRGVQANGQDRFASTDGIAMGDSNDSKATADNSNNRYPDTDGRAGLSGTQKKKGKSHWGCLWTIVVLALVGFILFATNPDKEKHWEKITNEVGEAVVMEENDVLGIGGTLNSLVTDAILSFGKNYFTVQDYGIFSIGKVNYTGEEKTISLGVASHVFTFDKEDVTQYLQEAIKNDVASKAKGFTKSVKDELVEQAKGFLKDMFESLMGDQEE